MADNTSNRVRRGTPEWHRVAARIRKRSKGGGSPVDQESANDDAAALLEREGLGGFVREHRFHPEHGWAIDFVWLPEKVAFELEGLNLSARFRGGHPGGHRSVEGYEDDCVKYNEVALAGFLLVRTSTRQMGELMVPFVRRALAVRRADGRAEGRASGPTRTRKGTDGQSRK